MNKLYKFNKSGFFEEKFNTKEHVERDPSFFYWYCLDCHQSEGEVRQFLIEEFASFQTLIDELQKPALLPKFDFNGEMAFVALNFWYRHSKSVSEQQNRLLIAHNGNCIYTFSHHKYNDPFEKLALRIQNHYLRYFNLGIDHLFVAIIDTVVDEYLIVAEEFREPLEDMELLLVKKPFSNIMSTVFSVKSELYDFRRQTIPLREELHRIKAEVPTLISKHNSIFFRNIIDNLTLLNVNIETTRELLRDITELHNSNQNLQLNNTMKTLTAISAVFIPLTFIVGVYGMNFKHMPILEWQYGYLYIWIVMILISAGLVFYMKKKKWW